MSWGARYPGVCDYCGEPIHVGDEIVWEDPDERTIRHARPCLSEPLAVQSGETPCPRCTAIHPGEC